MFFMIGISDGRKDIAYAGRLMSCPGCGHTGSCSVFMTYTVLLLFSFPALSGTGGISSVLPAVTVLMSFLLRRVILFAGVMILISMLLICSRYRITDQMGHI